MLDNNRLMAAILKEDRAGIVDTVMTDQAGIDHGVTGQGVTGHGITVAVISICHGAIITALDSVARGMAAGEITAGIIIVDLTVAAPGITVAAASVDHGIVITAQDSICPGEITALASGPGSPVYILSVALIYTGVDTTIRKSVLPSAAG